MDLSYYIMALSSKYTKAVNTWHTWSSSLPATNRCISHNKCILIVSWKELFHTFGGWHLHHVEEQKKCLRSAFIVTCYVHLRKHARIVQRIFLWNWVYILLTADENILKYNNIDKFDWKVHTWLTPIFYECLNHVLNLFACPIAPG